MHTQHPLFEGGMCAPCKVSREVKGARRGLSWSRGGSSRVCPSPRTSSWTASSCTTTTGTSPTAPSAVPERRCSSAKTLTAPGEARSAQVGLGAGPGAQDVSLRLSHTSRIPSWSTRDFPPKGGLSPKLPVPISKTSLGIEL